tara:strand:+ start:3681 stop:4577 length:897 start_codon:yes stop_codon:yes gene_type:complete
VRIAYYGDGPWAHKALVQLLELNYDVRIVVVRFDKKDERLIEIAEANGIEVSWTKNVNHSDWIEKMKAISADLAISMSFNQIVRSELRSLFPLGFINCHAGKLPNYRGRNILNWALINDEREIGVTCHYIDDGIDTGDIIRQEVFPIDDTDDYATLLKKAIDLCPDVLLKAVEDIKKDTVVRTPQPKLGSYFIARKEGDEFVNWNSSSKDVFNFVRAITTPGPWARSRVQRAKFEALVKIKKVEIITDFPNYKCINGAVVGLNADNKPMVKTDSGAVVLSEYGSDREGFSLRVGDRLI